jgi:hypothetical protein
MVLKNPSRRAANDDSVLGGVSRGDSAMIGRQAGDQSQLFSLFNLEECIPARHFLRRINPIATRVLADLREKLKPFYRETGRRSIDPELTLKMLIVTSAHHAAAMRRPRREP